jgi:outer membrane receptor protein involved in Fe transport
MVLRYKKRIIFVCYGPQRIRKNDKESDGDMVLLHAACYLHIFLFKEGTYVPQVDKREDNLAGYIEMRQLIGSLITLNAGLRADRHFTIGTELVPQAGVALNLPAGAGIKFSAGKGFRYPIIREMYMYPPQNPDLKPESLWNYELSFSQRLLAGKLNYGINLFYIDAKNIILILPNPNGAGMLNQNSGKLKNSGVELQASYLISKSFAVNGNYSFLDMETPVIGAPKHKAYLGGSYSRELAGKYRLTVYKRTLFINKPREERGFPALEHTSLLLHIGYAAALGKRLQSA